MSILSELFKRNQKQINEVVNDVVKSAEKTLIASTISEFANAVQDKNYYTVFASLYVDTIYVKDMINKDPAKAIAKLDYILKELDDACKIIKKD